MLRNQKQEKEPDVTRVAAVQMVAANDLATNLSRADRLIAQAAARGAELIVLPENFAYFGCRNLRHIAQREATYLGPVRTFLSEQSKRHKVWLVGGTIPVADNGSDFSKGYATCFCYNGKGVQVASYQKIHLFDVDVSNTNKSYRESDDYQAGSKTVVVDSPFGKLGLSVCYDLRFAELYRQLSDRGADIIVVPSAFTATTGRQHWELLLRARAVENQVFMIGANMGDRRHATTPTWGGSSIVHPWGNVLADMQGGEGVVISDIDVADIAALKKNMPIAHHRRL